jgi:hypothetical protein
MCGMSMTSLAQLTALVLFGLLMTSLTAAEAQGPDVEGQTVPRNVPPVNLFDELDYTHPGLESVKATVDAGDLAAAKATLLKHFRTRDEVQEPPPGQDGYDTALADELLRGRFIWKAPAATGAVGDRVLDFGPDVADIEWYKDPLGEGVHVREIIYYFGRHYWVNTLVDAYRNTGDEKYIARVVALLGEFMRACPVEDGRGLPQVNNAHVVAQSRLGREGLATAGSPAIQWTLMAALRRAGVWSKAWPSFILSEEVTPDWFAAFLTSMIEHQRYLADGLDVIKTGNHATRTAHGLLEVAAGFPEFVEQAEWMDAAIGQLCVFYNYIPTPRAFIYPDGATREIYPGVARSDLGVLRTSVGIIRNAGRRVPRQLTDVLEKMSEHYAYVIWPSQFDLRQRRPDLYSVPNVAGRDDIDYIETGGREGHAPEQSSYPRFSGEPYYAGTYWLRSDWSPKAVAMRVRFGPVMYKYHGRGFADVGDVGVWGHGLQLIPHLYNHPQSGPWAEYGDCRWRGGGKSTNIITVDGVGQSGYGRVMYSTGITEPLDNPWITTPVFDYLRGSYSFDPKQVAVTHTRAILFLKPDYFLVIDTINGEGRHNYRMKYQLHHDLEAHLDGSTVNAETEGQVRIVVAPSRPEMAELAIIKGQEEPFYEGWHLHSASRGTAAPALIYEWAESVPALMETLIWPIAPGGAHDVQIVREIAAGGQVSLQVRRGNAIDHIEVLRDGLNFMREEDGRLVSAGMVNSRELEKPGIRVSAPHLGAAYLLRTDDDGFVAASNCSAEMVIEGARIQTLAWQGQ